jgi:hypothetical protein
MLYASNKQIYSEKNFCTFLKLLIADYLLREAQASDAVLLHKPVVTSDLQRIMASLLN